MARITEYTHKDENTLRIKRRELINKGAVVSLMAFDPSRNVYTFDVRHAD